jgi:hypothetical protein
MTGGVCIRDGGTGVSEESLRLTSARVLSRFIVNSFLLAFGTGAKVLDVSFHEGIIELSVALHKGPALC